MLGKDKVTEQVCVIGVKDRDTFMTSGVTSRSGFSMALMSASYVAAFEREDGTVLQLNVPDKAASALVKGMKGNVTYKGNKFIEFQAL